LDYYQFRIDVEKIRPLLQRDLYKDPDTALREIVQNSLDALKRRAKKNPAFDPVKNGRIVVDYDNASGTLKAFDNGVGLSRTALINIFRYYGRSDKGEDEIGTFGLGAKSIFAIADSFTIHTRSIEDNETNLIYVTLDGLSFQSNPPPREDYGTTLTIPTEKLKDASLIECSLQKFCKCVRLPIYIKRNDEEKLISQESPFIPSSCIRGDGIEVYLSTSDRGWHTRKNDLYIDGIFVCQFINDNVTRIAVNVTRKSLVNLTMSRDSAIEDETYKALLAKVEDTIVDFVNTKLKLKRGSLEHGEWPAVKWVHESCDDAIAKRFTPRLWVIVEELCTEVYRYEKPTGNWIRATRSDPLIDVLVRDDIPQDKTIRYAFKRLRDVEEAVGDNTGLIVIYNNKKNSTREAVVKWLEEFGIKELEVLTHLPKKRTLHTPVRTTSVDLDTTDWYTPYLIIFPWTTNINVLKTAARELRCSTIKLRDEERLKKNVKVLPLADLREGELTASVVFRGQQKTLTPSTISNTTEIAPVEYARLAPSVPQSAITFPKDLKSACVLLMTGARIAKYRDLKPILEATIPESIYVPLDKLEFQRGRLSQTIAAFDWNDLNSHTLFQLMKDDPNIHDKLLALIQKGKCRTTTTPP